MINQEKIDSIVNDIYDKKIIEIVSDHNEERVFAKLACKKALEGKNIIALFNYMYGAYNFLSKIRDIEIASNWVCEVRHDKVRFITEGTIITRSIHNTMALLGRECDCLCMDIVIYKPNEVEKWVEIADRLRPKQIIYSTNSFSTYLKEAFKGCVSHE